MVKHFVLNTGARIPSVGLGTLLSDPAVVGDAIYNAVKIGLALHRLFEEGVVKCEDLFITSKLWNDHNAPEDVPESLNKTLNDLQLEYLDLYLAYSSLGSPWMNGNVLQEPVIISIAKKVGKTPAQVALRWNIQMGHSVLPKSVCEERIKQNLDVYDWSIADYLLAKFSEIEQVRLQRGNFAVNPQSVYKTHDELWDGDI